MMMPGDPTLRVRIRTLAIVAVVALVASWRTMPSQVVPTDAPAVEASGARVMDGVRGLVGDGEAGAAGAARTIGSDAHARAVQFVVDQLGAMGVTAELQHGEMPSRFRRSERVQLVNIVAPLRVGPEGAASAQGAQTAEGSADEASDSYASPRTLVAIAAHIDSVPGAPGAGDDALGVASAIEVARALRARAQANGPYAREVVLVITDGEELGLLGAELFCREHPRAPRIGSVVNLDSRGTSGPAFIFETGPDTTALAEIMAARVPHPRTTSVAATIYEWMPNGTDFTVFREAGMTGFNVACIGSPRHYHQPTDTPENVDPLTAQHMAQTALALVEGLASVPVAAAAPAATTTATATVSAAESSTSAAPAAASPQSAAPQSPAPQSVWFDLFGFGVAHLPAAWMQLGALMALLLTLFGAVIALRCRWVRWSGILLSLGAAVAAIAVAALVGWGATHLARVAFTDDALKGMARQQSWIWPHGYLWICAGVTLLGACIALALRAVAVRASESLVNARWSHVIIGMTVWSAIALAVATVAPGASVVFMLPALMGAFMLAAGALAASRMLVAWPTVASAAQAAFAAMLVAAIIWLPLEPALADAFGLSMLAVTAARGALLALLLP
ncbi:MAG: M28 family peptidase [Phycisphaerales bacterium]|nr:M28 family peptidase [Phycisphaerales bacterium]